MSAHADAATIRSNLDHPVIDADGHQIEFIPLVRDLLAADAGEDVARMFDAAVGHAAMKQITACAARNCAPWMGMCATPAPAPSPNC